MSKFIDHSLVEPTSMTEIEIQISELLSSAMSQYWYGDRSQWWFIMHVKGYWLRRINEQITELPIQS